MDNMRAGESDGREGAKRADDTTVDFVPPPAATAIQHLPQIEGFSIRRVLGRGGMGTVYESQQWRPRRTVALKVIRPEFNSPTFRRRFETEVQVLATLEHPNIARVYETGAAGEGDAALPYYAMEFIPGAMTIEAYAAKHHLSVRQRIEMFLKVCDAVYAGHCRGVVHRDLKPENILVDSHGEPKVIDFGVARVLGASLPITTAQSDVGQLIGTVRYMSPEQIEGRPEQVDARSDVYTLGVILYELLTGELPYELANRTLPEIAHTIRETPPKHPSAICRTVGGDLETVLLKAIEKSRDLRYQTADALREDLARWLRGEPIEARRSTVTYILTRRFRQVVNRAPVASMLLAAFLVWLLLDYGGVRLVYEWTPINRVYRSALASMVPPINPAAAELSHVRVIAIDPESLTSLDELAAEHGIEGVRANDLRSARPLSGELMKRLAEANVAVVAWDLAFEHFTAGDEAFVEGVKALRDRGIPVLVVNPQWGVSEDGALRISPTIAPHVLYAFPSIIRPDDYPMPAMMPAFMRGREGWAHLALAMDQGRPQAVSGFAIRTVAAYRHPDWNLALRLNKERAEAELHYYGLPLPDAGSTEATWRAEIDRIRLSGFDPARPQPELNINRGDVTAVYSIEMPPQEALDRATHSYAWALRAHAGELQSAFRRKIVMIGDTTGTDRHDLGLGRIYDGMHIQAAAADAILRAEVVRLERAGFMRAMLAVGCVLGLIGGVRLGRPLWRVAAFLVLAIVALIGLSVWVFVFHRFAFNPLLPAAALLLTAVLAHWLQLARRDFAI